MSMVEATAKALEALDLDDGDQGAAALALRYAATIDEARDVAAGLARVRVAETDAGFRGLEALRARVTAQGVLAELGPKLAVLLEALGGTPAARSRHERAVGRRAAVPAGKERARAPQQGLAGALEDPEGPEERAVASGAAALDMLRARRAAAGRAV